jgi:hypothetical protein
VWYKLAQIQNIFLDDLRNSDYVGNTSLHTIRTSQEAINYVKAHGCPQFISFDHDLGDDDTAMKFVKWLVDYDMDNNRQIIPSDFEFYVHSANPVGKANIESYLNSYLKQRGENVV